MSRAKRHDSSNDVQLFPFVAVLLCTMGTLLVILVAVTRTSQARAREEATELQARARAEAAVQAAEYEKQHAAELRELDAITKYQSDLSQVSAQAAERLHQEQARLSHLEDHMRRLREQLESLKVAAAELNSLAGEHYDDRKQAEQEIERLEQLIAESRATIDELRREAKARSKAYAIVPYQGRSGTFRRPLYIECLGDKAVLQPEGIVFSENDFQPPIGPGNPLVAALRAANEYIIRSQTVTDGSKQTEPYPLIVMRPSGIHFYYYVREAIQSWDSEFGYEMVEEDCALKYAPADPQLAAVENQAAQLARMRLRALAEAAPGKYGAYRFGYGAGGGGADDKYDEYYDDGEGDGFDADGSGSGSSPRFSTHPEIGAAGSGGREPGQLALVGSPGGRGATGAAGGGGGGDAGRGIPNGGMVAAPTRAGAGTGNSPETLSAPSAKAASAGPHGVGSNAQPAEDVERKADGTPANGSYVGGDNPEAQFDQMARAAADDDKRPSHPPKNTRGKDWAIRNGGPGMIPIRRSIQIAIRADAVAILPDASSNDPSAAGKEFPIAGVPDGAYEDLLSAIDRRIQSWGMAGQGLYWRPVVEMKVDSNAERRYNELARLLRYSGADVRNGDVAQQTGGAPYGTQR